MVKITFAAGWLLLAGVAEGAFHDGISGSSLRFEKNWNQREQQQSRNLQSFTGSTSAKDSCLAAKRKEESDLAPGGGVSSCKCELSELDERYADFINMADQPVVWELMCVDQRCSYCSADGSTCDRFSYGALFEEVLVQNGANVQNAVLQVAYFETNQYIIGRPEAVVYTEYNDPDAPGSHGCSMAIDGLECAVCEYIDCMDSSQTTRDAGEIDLYYGLNVVCSNILLGDGEGGYLPASDFETCDTAQIEALGQTQGAFEMYDPDYGECYTSMEACNRDKAEMEQNAYYDCACVDGELQGVSPFLENIMLQCVLASGALLEGAEICETLQRDDIKRTFSSYAKETNTRTITLDTGSVLEIEEFDCLLTRGFNDGCSSCKASVDGVECDVCEMTECAGGTEVEASLVPSITCGNAIGDSKINFCEAESAKGTPFEAFAECGFGTSKVPVIKQPDEPSKDLPPPLSFIACSEQKKAFLQRTDNFIDSQVLTCECYLIDEEGIVDSGTLFECTSTEGTCEAGSVCNADYEGNESKDKGTCFREELVEGFLPDGSRTPMTRTSTYTHGTDQGTSMVGRTLVLTEYGNGSQSCQLLVDGEACNSCTLENCGEGVGMRPLVDCSNVDASFALDTCDAFKSYEGGFLARLVSGATSTDGSVSSVNDFGICRDATPQADSEILIDHASLPKVCEQAQPIVLPTIQDDPIHRSVDLTNPNANFGFVSFVSSTKGLSLPDGELSSVQSTCENQGEEGSDYTKSPGLWYSLVGTGKGVRASVCRESTDFDARISIYQGSCDAMDCAVSALMEGSFFKESCDVHWIAEEGATYYLRVHGTSESETGTFNLFLEALDPEVTDNCYYDEVAEFSKACLSCSKAMSARIQQFENDPAEIDCQCIENPGSGGYHLTCVDLSCLKCNPRHEVCGFDTFEQEIRQSGDSPFGSYESFYFMNKAEGTQANEIVSVQNTDCLEILDPYQQCMMAKEELMAKEEYAAEGDDSPILCECRQTSPEGNHMLICSLYDSYEYCVDDNLCADTVLFGQKVSQYGSITSEFRNYILKADDSEETSITVERQADMCVATINGEVCSKCDLLDTCVGNRREEDALDIAATGVDAAVFTDVSIDCSNLVTEGEGTTAVFECGSVAEGDNNNLLSILAATVVPAKGEVGNTKDQTIPPDAFPPTMPPVTRPTSPPVDPPSMSSIIIDEEPVEAPTVAPESSSAQGLAGRSIVIILLTSAMALVSFL